MHEASRYEPEHGDDLLQLVRRHRQLEEENDGIDEDQEISRDGLISSRKRVADRNHRSVRTVAVTPGVSAALPRGAAMLGRSIRCFSGVRHGLAGRSG